MVKGLFNRAIIMSGSAFCISPRKNWAFRLAKVLGYGGDEVDSKILQFLQQCDPVELTKAQEYILTEEV